MIELIPEDRKCGFGLVSQIRLNITKFTVEQQNKLQVLLQRPTKETSIVSPLGIFRIHYDYAGNEAPNYDSTLSVEDNVMQVALAIDSAYKFEVDFLNYPPPPADNGEGSDDLYDIYITSAGGDYGFTEPEALLENEKYTSFIEIHYNLAGFFTEGLAAMRVTVAHELHHAIQMGNYILRWDDRYFHEITSTAMEEFVFDTINDYYGYFGSYFLSPETPLPQTTGYNTAVWNIYLKDNFGYDIIKRQWEMMPSTRAMFAINNSLFERGSSFAKEFNKFGIWMYYTDYRAIPGNYFEEAINYPQLQLTNTFDFYSGMPPTEGFPKAVTHNILQYKIPVDGGIRTDTLVCIISNGDVQSAVINQNSNFPYEYNLFNNSTTGNRFLSDDYSSTFNVQNPAFWSVSEILNNIVIREDSANGQPTGSHLDYAYPSPFYYDREYLFGTNIFVTVNANLGQGVDFNVYTSGMELIVRRVETVRYLPGNRRGVIWNVQDDSGEKLASGVYIYTVKHGDELTTGKIAIFN